MNETSVTLNNPLNRDSKREQGKLRFYSACIAYFLLVVGLVGLAKFVAGNRPEIVVEPEPVVIVQATERPDFSTIMNVQEKKETFFNYLKPYIQAENQRIMQQRSRLLLIRNKMGVALPLSQEDLVYLKALSNEYKFSLTYPISENEMEALLRRVDIIPSSLVLAQAANESAWGTSRFARQGNNYFGQWCYSKGCGLVPRARSSDANHEVKRFDTVAESVRAYFMNINTYHSYRDLRLIRQDLRQDGKTVDGVSLSEGLLHYSARGEEYVQELQSMIYSNKLFRLDQA